MRTPSISSVQKRARRFSTLSKQYICRALCITAHFCISKWKEVTALMKKQTCVLVVRVQGGFIKQTVEDHNSTYIPLVSVRKGQRHIAWPICAHIAPEKKAHQLAPSKSHPFVPQGKKRNAHRIGTFATSSSCNRIQIRIKLRLQGVSKPTMVLSDVLFLEGWYSSYCCIIVIIQWNWNLIKMVLQDNS